MNPVADDTVLLYGKRIITETYRNGVLVNSVEEVRKPVLIANRQQLLDNIFEQLRLLETQSSITFKIYADQYTKEPCRIELIDEKKL